MDFTITITETAVVPTLTDRQWCQIGVKEDGKAEFGYTPQVETVKRVEAKRLEQTVESLDLPAVIRAINAL